MQAPTPTGGRLHVRLEQYYRRARMWQVTPVDADGAPGGFVECPEGSPPAWRRGLVLAAERVPSTDDRVRYRVPAEEGDAPPALPAPRPYLLVILVSGQPAPALLSIVHGDGGPEQPTDLLLLYTDGSRRALEQLLRALSVEPDRAARALLLDDGTVTRTDEYVEEILSGSHERRLTLGGTVRVAIEKTRPYDPRETERQVAARVAEFALAHAAAPMRPKVRIDITAGTKPMSFGARQAADPEADEGVDLAAWYVATEEHAFLEPAMNGTWPARPFPPVFAGLTVAAMVAAYGYDLRPRDPVSTPVLAVRGALARALLERPAWMTAFRGIRAPFVRIGPSRPEERPPYELALRDKLARAPVDLLSALEQAAVLERTGDGWAMSDRQFWDGTWLEYAIWAVFEEVRGDPSGGLSDVIRGHDIHRPGPRPPAPGATPSRPLPSPQDALGPDRDAAADLTSPVEGDIDVGAVCRGRLVLVECKDRGRLSLSQGGDQYKIGDQRRRLGGRYAKACVVSWLDSRPTDDQQRQFEADCRRARAQPIRLIKGEITWAGLVQQMGEFLCEWARSPVPEMD
jgi:hypothetical protein